MPVDLFSNIDSKAKDRERFLERVRYKMNVDKIRARKRKNYYNNQAKEIERGRIYRINNPEKVKESNKKWVAKNPEKRAKTINDYIKNREKNDPLFKLTRQLRARLRAAVKKDCKSGSAVSLLGCSIEDFKVHIENQFYDGMSWENYGFRGWHIDHKLPLSMFDLSNKSQLSIACHYTNLQPMWWRDNLMKGNKYGN